MATINQLRVERLAYFRELKRALRPIDSAVEKAQRHVDRVLDRKRNVPETQDWLQFDQIGFELAEALEQMATVAVRGNAIFGSGP